MVIHPSVAAAVQQALGASIVLRPLTGGTNERTFLAEVGDARWVVRSDEVPALSLQRAMAAHDATLRKLAR